MRAGKPGSRVGAPVPGSRLDEKALFAKDRARIAGSMRRTAWTRPAYKLAGELYRKAFNAVLRARSVGPGVIAAQLRWILKAPLMTRAVTCVTFAKQLEALAGTAALTGVAAPRRASERPPLPFFARPANFVHGGTKLQSREQVENFRKLAKPLNKEN